jgi:hypothetical protein
MQVLTGDQSFSLKDPNGIMRKNVINGKKSLNIFHTEGVKKG